MRSLLPLTFCYFAGMGLGSAIHLPTHGAWALLGCLGAASAVALVALRGASSFTLWLGAKLLLAAGLVIGLCLAPRSEPELLPLPIPMPIEGTSRLRARVEEVRHGREGRATSRIRVLWGERLDDGARMPEGARLLTTPYPLPEGAVVDLLASVRPTMPFRNPSPHPQPPSAHPTRGIARLASADAVRVISHPWPARLWDVLRSHVRTRLVETLPADVEPVARAILLGDPDALEAGDADAVRAAGLSHVFAVSGMHVTLLAGISVWLLRRALLRVRWLAESYDCARVAAGMGIPLALSIAAFTGGAPSGWRASLTTAIAWAVTACGRRPNPVAVGSAACLVFGVITPADALRPAFLLSIAATAALVSQPSTTRGDALHDLRSLVGINVRTTLATAPVVWWSFGSLPLIGLLANLLLVPVGNALLLLASAHALLSSVTPGLDGLSAGLLSMTARAFLRGAGACSELDPRLVLPVLSIAQGLALAAATAGLLFLHRRRGRTYVLVAALAIGGAEEWRVRVSERPRGALRVTFVDVGQGDAALVDLPNGELMLIDAGGNPQGGPDPGARALLPLLAARRRDQLHTVVLSHPHPDHYGGLAALIERLPIGELWDSGQAEAEADLVETSRQSRDLMDRAAARGARVLSPSELCVQPRSYGEATVRVIAPCPSFDPGYGPNDNSIVLRIDYAGRSVLFPGDIEGHAEQQLAGRHAPLRADVLKVPHHGSRTSSSEMLLHAVQPSVAVVSAGAWNPFGHPHPEVMARLRRHVNHIVDIGQRGGTIVRIEANGQMYIDEMPVP